MAERRAFVIFMRNKSVSCGSLRFSTVSAKFHPGTPKSKLETPKKLQTANYQISLSREESATEACAKREGCNAETKDASPRRQYSVAWWFGILLELGVYGLKLIWCLVFGFWRLS